MTNQATLNLPQNVDRFLNEFLESAKASLGTDLKSAVLYGSAAEGKLRLTSDVNLVLVLSNFDSAKVNQLREPLRVAQAAIKLAVMFLLQSEVEKAVELFAVKFADIHNRRKVLIGDDPFANVSPPRQAIVARLKQNILNLTLRMRAMYAYQSLREEQIVEGIAEFSGPVRVNAATILELEGKPAASPKEALKIFVSGLSQDGWDSVLSNLSEAREKRELPSGAAPATLLRILDLLNAMQLRAEKLS